MQPLAGVGAAGGSGAGAGTEADPRLKPAAHEFEASLMKEFLEPLQKNALFDDGKDASGSDGSENALMSFGAEALARAISDRGGFGIAAKIIEQLQGRSAGGRKPGDSENSLKTGGKN